MHRIKKWFSYSNLVATFAIVMAMGGAAYAVSKAPKNSVTSPSIRNGAITGKDVKDDSLSGADVDEKSLDVVGVRGAPGPVGPEGPQGPAGVVGPDTVGAAEVVDNSLTGADIDEATLTEGRVARQGGKGRYGFDGQCDPELAGFTMCAATQIVLESPGRLFINGTALAETEAGLTFGSGRCRLSTTTGPINASEVSVVVSDVTYEAQRTLTAVSDVLPAGTHTVRVECNELVASNRGIKFPHVRLSVVGLSAA